MKSDQKGQSWKTPGWQKPRGPGSDLITPNPKLRLLDQVREVMRLKHYSIRAGLNIERRTSNIEH